MGKVFSLTAKKIFASTQKKAYGIDVAGISLYQQWAGYPQSPVGAELTTYPYQCVVTQGVGWDYLFYSTAALYQNGIDDIWVNVRGVPFGKYKLTGGVWVFDSYQEGGSGMWVLIPILESNHDIYNAAHTVLYFAKTTP